MYICNIIINTFCFTAWQESPLSQGPCDAQPKNAALLRSSAIPAPKDACRCSTSKRHAIKIFWPSASVHLPG